MSQIQVLVAGGGTGAVSSITGTANQVLANGTSGTPQTGAVTLTLPQSIATSSTVQFGVLSLGATADPSAILSLFSTNKGFLPTTLSTAQKNAIVSPATGLLLYDKDLADIQFYNGVSWVSSSGATSVAGTANQVLVNGATSPATGAVTLSFALGLSIGSYQATTPPTGGIIVPSQVGIGLTNPTSGTALHVAESLTAPSGDLYQARFAGAMGASSSTVSNAAAIYAHAKLDANVTTITKGYGIFVDTGTQSGTITTGYGIFVGAVAYGTTRFGGYFTTPSGGTAVALYSDNQAVGGTLDASSIVSISSTTLGFLPPRMTTTQKNAIGSPTAGLVVYDSVLGEVQFYNGSTWVGTVSSGVTSVTGTANQITASPTTGAVVVSFPTTGIVYGPAMLGTSGNLFVYNSSGTFGASSGTVSSASNIYLNMNATTNVGTITAASAIFIDTGGTAGTVTTGYGVRVGAIAYGTTRYGGFFSNPSGGTAIALYGANLNVGYAGVAPPSAGLICSGHVGFGSSNPNANTGLYVTYSLVGTTGDFWQQQITGSFNASSGTIANAGALYLYADASTNVASISNVYAIYIETGATAATVTNGYGIRVNAINYGTNRYGLYVAAPGGGTNKYTAYFDAAVGIGTANPAGDNITFRVTKDSLSANSGDLNQVFISGTMGANMGFTVTNAVALNVNCQLAANLGTVTNGYGLLVQGGSSATTITTGYGIRVSALAYGTTRYGLYVDAPTGGTNNFTAYFGGVVGVGVTPVANIGLYAGNSLLTNNGTIAQIYAAGAIGANSGQTVSIAGTVYVSPTFTNNAGTITSAAGVFIQGGSSASTVTTGYGLYVDLVGYGTTRYGAYINAPTGGTTNAAAIFGGNTIVGLADLATSATNGFLYIPRANGQHTGTPTAFTGTVPMLWNYAQRYLNIYDTATSAWYYVSFLAV